MIKKIKSVSNMGVFDGYRWPTGNTLSEFKRFNIVYSSNGSGKTTLSRLFSHFATGECEQFPDLKYSLEAANGTLKETDIGGVSIRVFNADYVRSNIGEIEGELNPIFIVGKDQKDLQAELAANEKELQERKDKLDGLNKKIETQENSLAKEFTEIAKLIGVATKGLTSRNYRKPDADTAYKKLTDFKVFSDKELEQLSQTAEQKKLDEISNLELGSIEDDVSSIADKSTEILSETVEANPQISEA